MPKLLTTCVAFVALAAPAIAQTVDLTAWEGLDGGPIAVAVELRYDGAATAEGEKAAVPVRGGFRIAYIQAALEGASGQRVARRVETAPETLRNSRRLLVVEPSDAGARVASAGGALTRAELDTVQLAADPLDIDALLPTGEFRDGGTWKVEPRAVHRLLRLESGEVCDVVAIVSDVTPSHARLRFAGPVHGLADGAKVEIDLRGVALFDRQLGRLTRVNLAWSEKRELGPATPAIELTAKLNLSIQPAGPEEKLSTAELTAAAATPDQRLEVSASGWTLLADRDWYVVADDRLATTLRRVAGTELAAMVTLADAGNRQLSPEGLEAEVRRALGAQLGGVLATKFSEPDSAGVRRVAVSSYGKSGDKPVEWRHYHLTTTGKALAATATLPALETRPDDAVIVRLLEAVQPAAANEKTAAAKAAAVSR